MGEAVFLSFFFFFFSVLRFMCGPEHRPGSQKMNLSPVCPLYMLCLGTLLLRLASFQFLVYKMRMKNNLNLEGDYEV